MCTVCVELRAPSVDITCLQSKPVRLIVSKALIVDIAVLRDTMSRWVVIILFPNCRERHKILFIVKGHVNHCHDTCHVNCCPVRCHVNLRQVRCHINRCNVRCLVTLCHVGAMLPVAM